MQETCMHSMHAKDQEKTGSNKSPSYLQPFQIWFVVFPINKIIPCQLPRKYHLICTISCIQTKCTGVLFCTELQDWTEAKAGSDYG